MSFSINRNSEFRNPDFSQLILLEKQAGET
jgi:hypothetical protein